MKGSRRWVVLAAIAGISAPAGACVDLFHSTDFQDLCDLDASACASEAGSSDASDAATEAAPIDFCKLDATRARAMASHACAWLGACSVPFDHNALGQCMIDAILALDCEVNPGQAVAPGALHDYWQALAEAKSCADVANAVNPKGFACPTTGFACAAPGSNEPDTVIECAGGVSGSETCLSQGRVCKSGACAPPHAEATCKASSCEGTVLHDCEGAADLGYDCASFGAGDCVLTDGGAACAPGGSPPNCAEGSDVTCKGDKATACPTGRSVTIDCKGLTGAGTCKAGTPSPLWNVAGQCQGSGSCKTGCSGDEVTGCAQGAAFTVSCTAEGLGACRQVKLPLGQGYACKPPGG